MKIDLDLVHSLNANVIDDVTLSAQSFLTTFANNVKSTGGLFFDVDGTGATAQVQLAQLSNGLSITNNDLFVIA